MIGWLQGQIAEPWQQAHRCGLLLVCQGVGYEVHLTQRHWPLLPPIGSELTLHIHHSIRDDAWTLYGFAARHERDLFRELVAVSGVGPQMALALLGSLECQELVRAIVQGDLRRLCQAPGVGKRTAERLSVELRQRLRQRYSGLVDALDPGEADLLDADGLGPLGVGADGVPPFGVAPEGSCRDEVQITLAALGYEPLEIHRALRAVAAQELGPEPGSDDWIRECLRWLSRAVA